MSRVVKSNRVATSNRVAKSNRVATSNRQYGFTPKDISGCLWWLRADDVTVKQGGVSEINDKSGNGHIVTQSTNSLRATLVPSVSAFNNKPTIRFTKTQWYEKIGGVTLPYGSNPMTGFMVISITTIPDAVGPSGIFSLFTNTTGTLHFYARIQGTGVLRVNTEGTTLDTTLSMSPTNSAHIMGFTFTQNDVRTYKDGTAGETNAGQMFLSATTPLLRLGTTNGSVTPTDSFFGGDIAEIIVYNSVLSTENRQKVEKYLKLRYNIA
jgi:hypothetical protein